MSDNAKNQQNHPEILKAIPTTNPTVSTEENNYLWRWVQLCKLAMCIILGHRANQYRKEDNKLLPPNVYFPKWSHDWLQPHWLLEVKKECFPDVEFNLFPISNTGDQGALVYSGRFYKDFAHPKSKAYRYCLEQDKLHNIEMISKYAADTYGEKLVQIKWKDSSLKNIVELNDSLLLYWCKNEELVTDGPRVKMLYSVLFAGTDIDESERMGIVKNGLTKLIQSNRHFNLMCQQAMYAGYQGGFDYIRYNEDAPNE
jgi:hypothetical protein